METLTAPAPPRPRADEQEIRSRQRLVVLVTTVMATFLLIASGLLLAVTLGDGDESSLGDAVEIPGGSFVVHEVAPEVMVHPEGMPAGMMPDPIPEGAKRFSVDVTLFGGDDALDYAWDDFRVVGTGVRATAPNRGSLGRGTLPPDARVTGALLFEVPEEATSVTLRLVGQKDGVTLELPEGGTHAPVEGDEGDKGGAGHPDDDH